MLKKIFIPILLTISILKAQKSQTVAYVDMDYILENIPEYYEAQVKLDSKVSEWDKKIGKSKAEIEKLKLYLSNERILLTDDLILEREEDILVKEIELKKMQERYFGAKGLLFTTRQKLVKPIQDEVYNAIQTIVKKYKYDFVFDRSSDLIILHANPRYDISKIVVKYITKSKKEIEREEARQNKQRAREALKKRIEDRKKKREEIQKKTIRR